jgi:hypothetical protein
MPGKDGYFFSQDFVWSCQAKTVALQRFGNP